MDILHECSFWCNYCCRPFNLLARREEELEGSSAISRLLRLPRRFPISSGVLTSHRRIADRWVGCPPLEFFARYLFLIIVGRVYDGAYCLDDLSSEELESDIYRAPVSVDRGEQSYPWGSYRVSI